MTGVLGHGDTVVRFGGRLLALTLSVALLSACGGKTAKPDKPAANSYPDKVTQARPDKPGEYTAGGLYKPGVPDGGPPVPPDIGHLVEPEPTDEPPSRYGNRSPYTVLGKQYYVMDSADGYVARGIASWYGSKFHGRATSSLEPYDMYQFTAAHKSLPLPTHVRVTHLANGRSVVVRVNDRGPFHEDRLIDLSYAAAIKLGMHIDGTAPVEIRVLKPGEVPPAPPAAMPPEQAWAAARRHALPTSQGAPVEVRANAPAAKPEPASLPGRVWLQVASFAEPANAQRLVEQLQQKKIGNAGIQRAQVGNKTVYRVRLGPYASNTQSDKASRQVRDMGLGVPTLITE